MRKIKLLLLFICAAFNVALSQTITQTVKGKVYDSESQSALPGASVVILNTNPGLGNMADEDGLFKITGVPIGRYNIQVSFLGYETVIIPEILVSSGKEVVLNISLKQSVTQMDEVKVKAFTRKDRPLNTMAAVSARSFTVEETRRYAGGLDDPARMASAFAGVTVGAVQDNAITIRGNSPKGVSWRLEGVEIPNPNHFAGGNIAGGGAVTIFSSQLLTNSDFFTGAFPSEYGNALAGVFDMKLRNGNNERFENTFQAGLMGIDVASEGPLGEKGKASYLFNYRYSTTGILSNMGMIPSQQVPKYQDLSFKFNFPTKTAGTFSFWGVGALDDNNEPVDKDSMMWESSWDKVKYNWGLDIGAAGANHKMILGNQSFVSSTVAVSGTRNNYFEEMLDKSMNLQPSAKLKDNSWRITMSSYINHKFNAQTTLKTGVNYHEMFYNLDISGILNEDLSTYQNVVKENGHSGLAEFYAQAKYEISSRVTLNGGINTNYFLLNDNYSVDPRLSVSFEISPKQTISLGYGKHSQLEELKFYFISENINGRKAYLNKDLDFSKAHHIVLSYDWRITDKLRLKVEPYFQYLYDIPGIADSSYSMANFSQDWTFREKLENNSTGRNYGIDLTFERFLNNNFYYLVTTSVFSSEYKADDGVWRNTRFNKNFSANLLVGKEFFTARNKVIGINARFNYIGGERYSPLNEAESIVQQRVVSDEAKAFEKQFPATYYLDLTLTYRTNHRKFSGTWALQVKNALGSIGNQGFYYNLKTKQMEKETFTLVLPVLSYKIEF